MTQETGGFAAFNLNPNILAAVAATGYEEPSAIQQQSIPIIMAGQDMIGQAQTGTGKTAAFTAYSAPHRSCQARTASPDPGANPRVGAASSNRF
jgi:superfamily II DNA/RNA helicase